MTSKIGKVLLILLRHVLGVLVPLAVVLGVRVEALSIAGVPYWRDDGALSSAAEHVVPVNVLEEGVIFDAAGASADVAEASGSVDCAEGADDVFGLVGQGGVLGERDWFFYNSGS